MSKMPSNIPWLETLDAYRQWNKSTGRHTDVPGFLKFIGSGTFGKVGNICVLPAHAIERIKTINGPNGHTLLRAHLLHEEVKEQNKMTTWTCPNTITDLFDDPQARPAARQAAIDWLKALMPSIGPDDIVWMPNAETGELEQWKFTRKH